MSNSEESNDWAIGQLSAPKSCKASEGYYWFKRAYTIFKYQPMVWMVIVFFISLASVVGSVLFQSAGNTLVKAAGGLLVLTAFQIFSAGFFVASHRCDQDQHVDFTWIFLGLTKWVPLAIFSAIYFVVVLMVDQLCHFLSQFYGSGVVDKLAALTDVKEIQKMLSDPAIQAELIIYSVVWVTLILLLAMLFGFSPALIMFHNVSPVEAIKLSMIGFLRNINAFAVYGLLLIGISVVVSVLIVGVQALLLSILGAATTTLIIMLLLMLAMYYLMALAWISLYTAYTDIFWLRSNEMSA